MPNYQSIIHDILIYKSSKFIIWLEQSLLFIIKIIYRLTYIPNNLLITLNIYGQKCI